LPPPRHLPIYDQNPTDLSELRPSKFALPSTVRDR
jgi:hypothetical protein